MGGTGHFFPSILFRFLSFQAVTLSVSEIAARCYKKIFNRAHELCVMSTAATAVADLAEKEISRKTYSN